MSALLDAVAAERADLLAPIAERLAVLDEIERLAGRLNNAEPPPAAAQPPVLPDPPSPRPRGGAKLDRPPAAARKPAAKAPRAAAARVGRDGLGETTQAVLEALRANRGWMSRAEITAIIGPFNVKSTQKLVDRGLVKATGTTNSRRYRVVDDDSETAGSTAKTVRTTPPAPPPAPAAGGPAIAGLSAGARRVLRARLVDHLGRRRLNAQSLADHLNVELAHVDALLAELEAAGEIVHDPDGRYRTAAS